MGSMALAVSGTLQAMATTLRNLFRRPNTVQYPAVRRPIPSRWRGGTFALTYDPRTEEENCIGCRLCEYICPSQIISVELVKGEPRKNGKGASYAGRFTLDYQACMQCELCVQVCPADAIVMLREPMEPCFSREGLFLDRQRLFANGRALLERPQLESEATASRLQEWTDARRGLEPVEPAPAAGSEP